MKTTEQIAALAADLTENDIRQILLAKAPRHLRGNPTQLVTFHAYTGEPRENIVLHLRMPDDHTACLGAETFAGLRGDAFTCMVDGEGKAVQSGIGLLKDESA